MTSQIQCADCETMLLGYIPKEVYHDKCPICGSTRRVIHADAHNHIDFHERIGLKQKHQGIKKPIYEQIAGAELTRSIGRLRHKVRIIDREHDRYYERITDPQTGQVVHERDEPLSHHYGRGTARLKNHGLPHDHVAIAAYYIWEKKGRLIGHEKVHWNMAIEDLTRAAADIPTLYS